jgi:hypothetical protein
MPRAKPCMAITLIYPQAPEYAASYHWCKLNSHDSGMHECYCGIWWLTDDLVEPTPEMVKWRTGTESEMRGVSTRLLGYTAEVA